MTGTNNMWVNIGRHQFHLPTAERGQRLRGTAGLVVPDLDRAARSAREAAHAAVHRRSDGRASKSPRPWGNRIRAHAPDPRFGPVTLALAYLEFDVAPGARRAIAGVLSRDLRRAGDADRRRPHRARAGRRTRADLSRDRRGRSSPTTATTFKSTSRISRRRTASCVERKLVTRRRRRAPVPLSRHRRPDDGQLAFTLEHEVRSLRHPLFGRHLVNRDPAIDLATYAPGREAFAWAERPSC